MTERSTGFRFDIYERVYVPEGMPGIGDLEQVELVPQVSGIPGQEHSVLKGHLQLSAVYMPDGEGTAKQSFEHNIPVEISLPVRSDPSEGGIQVLIDQFDVELISQRSLNVTGVLSLSGWDFPLTGQSADERNDEIVAIHHAGKPNSEPVQVVAGNQVPLAPLGDELAKEANAVPSDGIKDKDEFEEKHGAEEKYGSSEGNNEDVWGPLKDDFEGLYAQESHKRDEWVTEEQVEEASALPAAPVEPKVAFKPQAQDESDSFEDDEAVAAGTTNNSLEWRKLFLHGNDETRFQKLRMCIVNKEDTIQTIAERYKLQPREIALYNRLGESDVSEGQILYIPAR